LGGRGGSRWGVGGGFPARRAGGGPGGGGGGGGGGQIIYRRCIFSIMMGTPGHTPNTITITCRRDVTMLLLCRRWRRALRRLRFCIRLLILWIVPCRKRGRFGFFRRGRGRCHFRKGTSICIFLTLKDRQQSSRGMALPSLRWCVILGLSWCQVDFFLNQNAARKQKFPRQKVRSQKKGCFRQHIA